MVLLAGSWLRAFRLRTPRVGRPRRMITKVTNTLRESQDLAEDARQLLAEIDRDVPGAARINADCRPPIDVFETTAGLEVVVDVPGVPADSLRVVVRRSTLLIVGAKMIGSAERTSRYHIAERSYGRFARAVRLAGAFDAGEAKAVTHTGQLRITLPRLDERRGQVLRIPVERE
jgi:HSP20 family protein